METYDRILKRLNVPADQFMMVGNSLKSDIMPVLNLGGHGVHIPYPVTWEHERIEKAPHEHEFFYQIESMDQLSELLQTLEAPKAD